VVPATVVPEAAWLIEDRLGPQAEARFLRFVTSDLIKIVDLGTVDYSRCIDLIVEYEDLGLGLVDASIVAIGERLDITQIATLNRRDFAVVRPRHIDAFDLLP
jgi:predicted nucleic acid-binding protein